MAANSRTAVSGRRTKTWLMGVYIRLSKEDARHLDESESVTNQRSIIEDYIASMDDGDEEKLSEYAKLLYDQALLIEGLPVEDPVAFSARICALME